MERHQSRRRKARAREQDTRILQRAYLSVRSLGIETYRTRDHVIGMIAICNTGRMPARKISWILQLGFDSDWRRQNFMIDEEVVGNNIIPAGDKMRKGTGPVPVTEFESTIATKHQFYAGDSLPMTMASAVFDSPNFATVTTALGSNRTVRELIPPLQNLVVITNTAMTQIN